MYQPGAPAALPGKTFFANNQSSRNSDIYKENLGPPVVGPCFSWMLGFGANNSTDTNKKNHPSRLKELLDDKYNYDYNINSQIKIQARKQGYNKERIFVTGSCDDSKLPSDVYRWCMRQCRNESISMDNKFDETIQ